MDNETLHIKITEMLPTAVIDASGEWLNVVVEPSAFLPFMQQLRQEGDLFFNYLFCLTCVDWKTHLTMVYHLSSTQYRHNMVVKVVLDRNAAAVETVSTIWRTAEMLEREVFELFGVHFLHHPDLRKLILPDDWVGYPLRKDYEDPINMIKL
jgi:NADH:ubiquinone oxidoreductase subunit C